MQKYSSAHSRHNERKTLLPAANMRQKGKMTHSRHNERKTLLTAANMRQKGKMKVAWKYGVPL